MSTLKAILVYREASEDMKKFTDNPIPTIFGKSILKHYVDILRERFDISTIYLYTPVEFEIFESIENVNILTDISNIEKGTYIIIPLDVYIPSDALNILVNYYTSIGVDVVVLVAPCENAKNMPTLDVDTSTGKIIDIVSVDEERPDLVLTGIYIAEHEIARELVVNDWRGVQKAVRSGLKIDKTYWSGEWCRIQTPWDLLALAKATLLSEREPGLYIHPKAKISTRASIEVKEGPVIIDENAYIDHDVLIRGPVYIGKNVYVGYGSLIRNFTIIEESSAIGSNVDITESVLLREVTVGRGSYISCSVIGEKAILEPGVVTRSVTGRTYRRAKGREVEKRGSIIGANSRIGAYTVLSPGRFIEKNTTIEPLTKL